MRDEQRELLDLWFRAAYLAKETRNSLKISFSLHLLSFTFFDEEKMGNPLYVEALILDKKTSAREWLNSPNTPVYKNKNILLQRWKVARGSGAREPVPGAAHLGTREVQPGVRPHSSCLLQCCRSGSGIRCFFDPGIRNRFFPDPGSQTHLFESLVKIFWVKTSIILWKLAQIFSSAFQK